MDAEKQRERLFSEFPPVSTQEWNELLIKDLKGADFDKKLVWKTKEGISVKPFYRSEDLKNLNFLNVLPSEFPFTRGSKKNSNDWHVRQDIYVDDIKKANKKALDILMKGVTSLGFIIDPKFEPAIDEIEMLCANIYADAVELNFVCYHNSLKVVQYVEKLVKKYNRDLVKIYGSVDFDPLGQYTLKGKFPVSAEASFDLAKIMIETARNLPNFKVITVNGSYFHNSGATLVETLAFSLSQGVNYLTQLTERGLSINEVAPRIKFQFATGPNYFMEIAKLRAARLLWAHIVKAYGPSDEKKTRMFVHAESSRWNKTIYDAHVNMLRTTTESMSAIIGGVDSLTVLPFNAVYENPADFSERIARNQQLLLKEESYLDKVTDPGAGSYYIENLTASLAEQAWKLFLEIQEKGGFLEAFRSGFVQARINQSAGERDMNIATRREILLGTNQYPNITELKYEEINPASFESLNQQVADAEVETLKPYRGSLAFEKLRLATDQYAKINPRPKVFLLNLGNLAMCRARAQFAGNFFGCAGYEIIDNNGFNSVKEAADTCLKSKARIAVICSSDEEYVDLAPQLADLLRDKVILVLAGFPKDIVENLKKVGISHFIHIKSNVLETLKEFQQLLDIKL
ncbi:MAG: acyl-CoA mutase large subunit family protein [Bacteroidales bacterium]|nr:acyl-CoA mutase large subunit family protein [Bacteroidales bacterium]